MKILNLNIGNPSLVRAQSQIDWLLSKEEYEIIVLTETKKSSGCNLITTQLEGRGYTIYKEEWSEEYGVIIATNMSAISFNFLSEKVSLRSRSVGVKIKINNEVINVIGIYIPSNDKRKNVRKRLFMESVIDSLSKFKPSDKVILCGDFNTVMRGHIPKYSMFRKWEYDFFDEIIKMGLEDAYDILYPQKQVYSWFGRSGNAYKYDYNFISKNLKKNLEGIIYSNETIEFNLSDHSATIIQLRI